MMRLGLGLGISYGGGGGVDLGAAVQAILSGTAGFARDPIAANLFQDTAGATPVVSAADPIGRINCQWGNAPPNWQQATAGDRPAWDATGIACDGATDHMATLSDLSLFSNVPGSFTSGRFLFTNLAATHALLSVSNGVTSTVQRFCAVVNTDGSIALQLRRLDADGLTTITTAAGLVTAGVPVVLSWQADWAGTGLGKIWVDGVERASSAIGGSAANTESTASLRARNFGSLNGTPPSVRLSGWARRGVTTPYVLSDVNRAAVEAWVGAA